MTTMTGQQKRGNVREAEERDGVNRGPERRHVTYVLTRMHRRRGTVEHVDDFALYTDARAAGLVFHNRHGYNMRIKRVSRDADGAA